MLSQCVAQHRLASYFWHCFKGYYDSQQCGFMITVADYGHLLSLRDIQLLVVCPDYDNCMVEALVAFRRAGADAILTYANPRPCQRYETSPCKRSGTQEARNNFKRMQHPRGDTGHEGLMPGVSTQTLLTDTTSAYRRRHGRMQWK